MPDKPTTAPDIAFLECDRSHTPNAVTIAALRETDNRQGKSYASLEDLFKDMRSRP
jgi:hypothetical protein